MNTTSFPADRSGKQIDVVAVIERYGLLAFCAVLVLLTAAVSPAFRSPTNLQNVLTNVAPLAIVVLGQSMVILVRGFDLSVSSVMATAAVIATQFEGAGALAFPLTLLATLVMSLIVGLANGFLVTKRDMSPFLATLATMIVLQGLRFAWTRGAPSGRVPPELQLIGAGQFFGVPVNLLVLAVLTLVIWVALAKTPFGRRVYMVGGGPRAAELVGVKVDYTVIACYVASAVLAGVGGLVLVGYVSGVDNWVGRGYELELDRRGGDGRRRALWRPRQRARRHPRRLPADGDLQYRAAARIPGAAAICRQGPHHHSRDGGLSPGRGRRRLKLTPGGPGPTSAAIS